MTLPARAASVAAVVGALCAAALGWSAPASAASSTLAPTLAPTVSRTLSPAATCQLDPSAAAVLGKQSDTPHVTRQDLTALPARRTTPRYVARHVRPRLARRVLVPVVMHVISGTRKGERRGVRTRRLRRAVTVLNQAMAGRASKGGAATRYRFRLVRVDRTRREGWYHAFFNGPRDQRMKRHLHVGGPGVLNVYVNNGGPEGEPVLGWSRFPWQYAEAPTLDGVSVNRATLPGGKATGYDRGDTLVHETGHWLGLLHTFEGGCSAPGDLVADTPPEAWPDRWCTRDTHVPLALDPARNYMDYSSDNCMDSWTPGQVRRMDAAFATWRLRRQ